MEELIKKIKALKRYDITPFHDGVTEDQYEDGDYIKWSDVEKLLNS